MAAKESDALPLTSLQQGMLYHWLQNPKSGADMEQMVCTLREEIDPVRLRMAWERAVLRHDSLRLSFDWSGPKPVQRINSRAVLPWAENPLSSTADFDSFLHFDRFSGFDLNTGPLMRLTLVRMSVRDWRLVWTFHHLLLDGRSITAILHEVFRDYDGSENHLDAPAATLSGYLKWQASLDHAKSTSFWKEHLRGVQGPPSLIIDRLGSLSSNSSRDEADHDLSEETTTALRTLADRADVTMNTLVQAAWALLISRYTGEESIVFGATRACRHTSFPGAKALTGLLINTVPLHTVVRGDQPFIPWLQSLRLTWIEMRSHELTPLPVIRRMAGLAADQPLFQHLVVFEHEDFTGALHRLQPDWNQRTFELRELTTVPLTLQVYGGQSLRLHCAFDTSRFDPEFIRKMLGHAAHLLDQFAASPYAVLDHFTIATAEECRALAEFGAGIEIDGDTTLHEWFAETAVRFPDRIAVTGPHGAWTYRELDQRSNAIAGELAAAGTACGDIVGLFMDRSGEIIAAILGILKTGAAYLPIDPACPAGRVAFMLTDAGVKTLLTDSILAPQIPKGSFRTILCDELPAAACSPNTIRHTPEQTAYIIYTSGSTGQPKGCMISHRNVVRLMRGTEPWFSFNDHDVSTLFHSAAFDFSVWEIWGALLYGGRLCVVPWLTTRSPDDFYRLVCQEGVTILNQTPSAFRQFIAAEPLVRDADSTLPALALRTIIFGGEALEMQSLRPWFQRHGDQHPRLVNMYGITETTVHVTYRPLSAADLDHGSVIGVPIPDLRVYVLDPHTLQPSPIGIPGEMYVAGAGLAGGYLNRPELTAARFPPNHLTGNRRLYKTGDLARFISSPAGLDLEFMGRIDDQVKIRGFRIELGEIESVLCTHPQVQEAAVLVREDQPGDQRLCAWIVAAKQISSEDLRAHLKSRLPDYMIPAAFVIMESFPLTTNGKLDRRALPAPVASQAAARHYTAPSTEVEAALAAIWQNVLRVERVGIFDNFFELGGDSILSIQVIARAREAGIRLTPRQLFENQTVAALAGIVTQSSFISPPVTAGEETGAFPLSPIQRWFFEQELEGAYHWNQSFLFSVSERLHTRALTEALRAVAAHHSALRLRFTRRGGTWEQTIHPGPDDRILSVYDLRDHSNGRLTTQIESICCAEQAGLNFESGPLLRAAYIDCGDDRPGRLLITVHHLAVDGVSWRLLLEDIENAYRITLTGSGAEPPPATAPFSAWSRQVGSWSQSNAAKDEVDYWREVIRRCAAAPVWLEGNGHCGTNTESSSFTIRTRLGQADTEALLKRVPAAWATRINDVLLTAFARTVHAAAGTRSIVLHAEGHGREPHIGGDLDVSRTVGWFTTIYPLCLELPDTTNAAEQIRSIQQQLLTVPGNGSGFSATGLNHEAEILFNYLGRMDSVTDGSELFSFATEPTGPWHCPRAKRKYQIEINAMVSGEELEVAWTAGRHLHSREMIQSLADGFNAALRDIIQQSGIAAPAPDCALSGLDHATLAQLTAGQSNIAAVCRLSPMQELFYSASLTKPNAGYDQWHCQLHGPLNVPHLRTAWSRVLARHSILRSSFHGAGLPHPVQLVHEGIEPEWQIIDASGDDAERTITKILADDAAVSNDLTKRMLSRFTLVHLTGDHHFFLWSVPSLHLDGWSWPIVFGEVSEIYSSLLEDRKQRLPPVRPYSTWLHWLAQQPLERSRSFWRDALNGISAPTPLPVDRSTGPKSSQHFARISVGLDGSAVIKTARDLALSPGTLVQGAWGMLLAHSAAAPEVVFGTAFSGRPADLEGADRIVGPFVNNLPVRLRINPAAPAASLLQSLQKDLFDISEHQFTPITSVQDCTSIPWQRRVFDSLVVFQNYNVGESARRLGPAAISHFTGPIHTGYPLTLVVTPGKEWEIMLVFHESVCSPGRAKLLVGDFCSILTALSANPSASSASMVAQCRIPCRSALAAAPSPLRRPCGPAPRTAMEKSIACLWQRAFGLSDITSDDNFFDLGGGSLLMVRLHAAIRQELGREVSLVDLFRFPTIAGLAQHLDAGSSSAASAVHAKDATLARAAAARAVASKARNVRTRQV